MEKRAKAFKTILSGFLNNGSTDTTEQVDVQVNIPPRYRFTSMPVEQRKAVQDQAHEALKTGCMVYMSKQTVEAFKAILHTPHLNSTTMRKLLESIAAGQLTITKGGSATPASRITSGVVRTEPRKEVKTVLSIDQLSGGMPFTLKQAARILNVKPNALYFRCLRGKVHFEKDRSRYLIPASEVQRLQVIGL